MRRLFGAAMGVALISMLFAGCKKEDPTYSVQVTATEGGTVEGQNGEYKEGETVVFTAIPADGYYFSQWSDGSTNNPRTVTIGNEDISLTALFAILFFAPTVDLGLESGTLWATCNLGAEKPWEYGDYYAWGETEVKDNYSWETYKYCKGSCYTLTKYCYDATYGNDGFTDNITTLLPEDDAATAVLGSDYSMPTVANWEELGDQCYWVWTENYNNHNVSGYIVYKAKAEGDKGTKVFSDGRPSASYSLSDAHIFLPAVGGHGFGFYWSASLFDEGHPYDARYCNFYRSDVYPSDYYENRYYGQSIRPVKRP